MDPVTLTFDVSRVYKGDVDASQAVVTANSGASCGLEVEGEGPFLVFAEDARSSIGKLSANLCGGTRAVGVDEPAFGPGTPPPGASATPEAPAAPAQAPEGGAPDWLVPVLVLAGVSLAAALGAALIVRTRRKSAD